MREYKVRLKSEIEGLHALRHREGMGKPALPPQGVGTPFFFGSGTQSRDGGADIPRYAWRTAEGRPAAVPHNSCYFRRSKSAATKRAKTTEMTPFMVKKAALRRERSSGPTRECS